MEDYIGHMVLRVIFTRAFVIVFSITAYAKAADLKKY